MIGQKSFDIDFRDFVKTISSSDYISDGGYSTRTIGCNPFAVPGLMYPSSPLVDVSTNLVGRMMMSVDNNTTASGIDRFMVARNTSTNDGTYYHWNGTALTLKRTDSTNNYTYGKNDIITFANEIYATSNEALIRWTADDVTFNVAFQAFNDSAAPHPALLYENNAYYGDGNELWRQTTVAVAPTIILTLPTDRVIISLGIDPGSGRMLISTVSTLNISNTLSTISRVDYYDGFSSKTIRTVIVDDMVTAFYPVGGTVYVTYGQRLGYWTGTGIQFLRKLTVTLDNASLAYKHHITNIGNTLYVVSVRNILAYGEIINGQPKAFYHIYKDSADIGFVVNLGSNKLGIGVTSANTFVTFDVLKIDHTTLGTSDFYSNKYPFDRPVIFNQVTIEFGEDMPTDGNAIGGMSVIDENGLPTSLGNASNTVSTKKEYTLPWPTLQLRSLQLNWTWLKNISIKRFTVFYTPKE